MEKKLRNYRPEVSTGISWTTVDLEDVVDPKTGLNMLQTRIDFGGSEREFVEAWEGTPVTFACNKTEIRFCKDDGRGVSPFPGKEETITGTIIGNPQKLETMGHWVGTDFCVLDDSDNAANVQVRKPIEVTPGQKVQLTGCWNGSFFVVYEKEGLTVLESAPTQEPIPTPTPTPIPSTRSKVMRYAWTLRKQGIPWGAAQSMAWASLKTAQANKVKSKAVAEAVAETFSETLSWSEQQKVRFGLIAQAHGRDFARKALKKNLAADYLAGRTNIMPHPKARPLFV